MSIGFLLVFVLVLILLFYLAGMIPDARGQMIARIAIVVFAILWLLSRSGFLGSLDRVRI